MQGTGGGIHPESKIAKSCSDSLFQVIRGNIVPHPDSGRAFGFWDSWHTFLEQQGIDFVKVDSQSAVLNYLTEHRPLGKAASAAHKALEASVALHFNHTIINCMGMAAENIWHRPKSAVSRNSDDFVPQDEKGFPEHALQNAYNSFYHGNFYYGDWDMYWTKNHDDVQSAVLRSISGGPIYFSDAPGNTDPTKVWPLIYNDGKIIRCDSTPSPTLDCLLQNPVTTEIPLKLWNRSKANGIVAAFNICESSNQVEGTVSPSEILDLEGDEFVIHEHFSGMSVKVGRNEEVTFALGVNECKLYTVVPIDATCLVVPIGLTNKYIPTDAVEQFSQDGNKATFTVRQGGKVTFFSASEPKCVHCNGRELSFNRVDSQLYTVDCESISEKVVIEISLA